MFVMMRSNDAYYGFRNDYYCFTELLKRLAQLSNLKVGEYWHWATSMHLYLPQVEKMHTLAKNWPEYEALSLAYQNQGFMD
jgi:thymidylate synthase